MPAVTSICRIEIRWSDLDSYGHVNQAVYPTYAEEVLDDWFRTRIGRAPETAWDYVARRTTIDYRSELLLADRAATGRPSWSGWARRA